MKTEFAIFMALLGGILSANIEMNYSYELKYGDGKQITPETQDTTDYSYLENLLDINTYIGDDIYIYSQLEYSDPPVFGHRRSRLDSMLNTFYIEYSHDRYKIKLGDLYELYGHGLALYTFQDQNIDYDNSIRGIVLDYFLQEKIYFSTLIGNGEYAYRNNAASDTTDRSFINTVISGSLNYENDKLGYFQYLYLNQQSEFESDMITKIQRENTELGIDLEERVDLGVADIMDKDVVNHTHNINWNYFSGAFDIYIDKSWISYEKIHGEKVFGSRFYTSIYTELLGAGITYEYKNYYTPYLIKSISNPPIVYREGSSILASRNVHSINIGNEIGHQIDFNKNIFGFMNMLGNLSISHRTQKKGMGDLSFIDLLIMDEDASIYSYYPFRQMYLEFNGWALSEQVYYKVGFDYFSEFINNYNNTFAFTIPTQWIWKLSNGSSFTIYLETQKKTVNKIEPIPILQPRDKTTNHYLSASYSQAGKWILTGFYDYENYSQKMIIDNELTTVSESKTKWTGLDFSYFFSSKTQFSLFYGSQKGGLVCANGICAEQPGFEDGYKITYRSIF